jgi:hypothetical protein
MLSATQQFQQLIKEIKLFIHYAVAEHEIAAAEALVDSYQTDLRVLRLLREYYVALPEAKEEPIVRLAQLVQRQGVFLFVAITTSTAHLYAVSHDQVAWLGEYLSELDSETLAIFGFASHEEFLKICQPLIDLDEYPGRPSEVWQECPACGVQEGEYHLLGCSVEVCPWCEGQLNKCNCRFEQLETEVIENDEQLEEFFELLTARGRIPFQQHQAPYYPGLSSGLDKDDGDG